MYKTDSLLGIKKSSLAWSCNHAIKCFVAFLGDISILISEMWKSYSVIQLENFFIVYPHFLVVYTLWKTVRLHGKKDTKCNKWQLQWIVGPKNAFLEPVNDCLACKSCMKNCLPCAVHRVEEYFIDAKAAEMSVLFHFGNFVFSGFFCT